MQLSSGFRKQLDAESLRRIRTWIPPSCEKFWPNRPWCLPDSDLRRAKRTGRRRLAPATRPSAADHFTHGAVCVKDTIASSGRPHRAPPFYSRGLKTGYGSLASAWMAGTAKMLVHA